MGVDGFRLDATSHFYEGKTQDNTEFLDWFQKELRRIKEDVYLVGEAWEPSQIRLEMYQSGLDSFLILILAVKIQSLLKRSETTR